MGKKKGRMSGVKGVPVATTRRRPLRMAAEIKLLMGLTSSAGSTRRRRQLDVRERSVASSLPVMFAFDPEWTAT